MGQNVRNVEAIGVEQRESQRLGARKERGPLYHLNLHRE